MFWWIIAICATAAVSGVAGLYVGVIGGEMTAIRDGWIRTGNKLYAVTPAGDIPGGRRQPDEPVRDNLGQRVRTLMDRGIFDAQIERAIQRNAKRRG